MFLENGIFNKMDYFIKNVIVILKLLFELNIYELNLKGSWIRINDNWIWDLIEKEVNWNVIIVIID